MAFTYIVYYMASSARGRDEPSLGLWWATRAGKLGRYCSLEITRFPSQNIFLDIKKIFSDFSVGIELENEKTERCHHFCWLPFQRSKIDKYEDLFFQCFFFMPYNKSFLDEANSVKMAGYWPSSLFAFSWTQTSSRSIKTQKQNLAKIQPSWQN